MSHLSPHPWDALGKPPAPGAGYRLDPGELADLEWECDFHTEEPCRSSAECAQMCEDYADEAEGGIAGIGREIEELEAERAEYESGLSAVRERLMELGR